MKTITLFLILFLIGSGLRAQNALTQRQSPMHQIRGTNAPVAFPAFPAPAPRANPAALATQPQTEPPDENASTNSPENPAVEKEVPGYVFNYEGVDVNQILEVYANLVGRTLLRAGLPQASIVLNTQSPLTKSEAIEALQGVLALNNISVVNVGDKFVKVLPSDQVHTAAAQFNTTNPTNLPDIGSYITRIVHLRYTKPSDMANILSQFAKLPNSIYAIDANGILILRDDAENVKRMLEMINQIDVGGATEIVSEVIPIKYALAEDIANALNSLGGGGGSTVSIGTTPSMGEHINGVGANGGENTPGGGGFQSRAPNGAPPATTFQQRLQAIVNHANGQQDQIQVFGQAKIIADQRSNSLLIFATAADMERIKSVVAKLDVLLSQVLIESVIMDVTYGHSWDFGVSLAQNPTALNSSVVSAGGYNNGQPFLSFLQQMFTTNIQSVISGGITNFITTITQTGGGAGTNTWPGSFTGVLPSSPNFSYLANIGPSWDVALQAAAADSTATVIQRPRIQTSQAKTASFFVGSTVPYVNSTYYGGTTGNQSSYSQLSVGVELDVTPFINPDGLVVMDINQEIDDISGSVNISGVGNVPTTDKRTLSAEIAVKDKDTIILGGFIRSEKDKSKTGVPLLEDLPIVGSLFSQRTSSKNRDELIVLMRPTVLRTPEIAAAQAIKEEQRLPGIAHAEADDEADAQKLIEAERKAELKAKSKNHNGGVYTEPLPGETNNVPQPNPTEGLY